jgi:uncharacterized membrane protein YGL010W
LQKGELETMLGGKSWDEWISEYSKSHQHPVNQITHKIGIPMIALSLPLFLPALFIRRFWIVPTALFVIGWIFQFIGHAFEGKPPEFFKDWRFLFVGLRWWFAKIRG